MTENMIPKNSPGKNDTEVEINSITVEETLLKTNPDD